MSLHFWHSLFLASSTRPYQQFHFWISSRNAYTRGCLADSVEHLILDLGILSWGPNLGIEMALKKKEIHTHVHQKTCSGLHPALLVIIQSRKLLECCLVDGLKEMSSDWNLWTLKTHCRGLTMPDEYCHQEAEWHQVLAVHRAVPSPGFAPLYILCFKFSLLKYHIYYLCLLIKTRSQN